MVRFKENALVIEIPCSSSGEAADYYEGLQNALFDVFWIATAKGGSDSTDGPNWIAAHLGPALCILEPAARIALNGLHKVEQNGASSEHTVASLKGLGFQNRSFPSLRREFPELSESRFIYLLQELNRSQQTQQNEAEIQAEEKKSDEKDAALEALIQKLETWPLAMIQVVSKHLNDL